MTDIPSWAVRGSKVVCIVRDGWDDTRGKIVDPEGVMTYPVAKLIYTIREVRFGHLERAMGL